MGMDDQIEQFIDSQPPETRAITRKMPEVVKAQMPGAYESIYHGALSYSASPSVYHRLVYVAVEKVYVRLGFNFGAYLADPRHMLKGEGKRLRHVKVYSPAEAVQPA